MAQLFKYISGFSGVSAENLDDRLSNVPRVVRDEMRQAGAEVAVAIGLVDAIAQLERWHLLRGAVR